MGLRASMLRITLDCDQGSRTSTASPSIARSTILDVEDLIPFHYTLEITSPGLGKSLTGQPAFDRHRPRDGSASRVGAYRTRSEHQGTRRARHTAPRCIVDRHGAEHTIPYTQILVAKTVHAPGRGISAVRGRRYRVNPNTPIAQNIETLAREKNIDPTIIISAIEDAVVTASRVKQFKTGEDLQARYNMQTGSVDLFAVKRVVEEVENDAIEISLAKVEGMGIEGAESGDILEFPRSTEDLGRIAAQTAKQIIFQKVREAERNNIYDEYIQRVGDIVHGYVKRFEGGRIIVDLGKVEAVLPRSQQSRSRASRGRAYSRCHPRRASGHEGSAGRGLENKP